MQKILLFLLILFPITSITIQAQCPEATAATILNRFSNGDGTYSFDLSVNYSANGTDNSSMTFTISICSGATLFTTDCYEDLKIDNSPYSSLIQNPALTVPIGADICITYEAYTSSQCNSSSNCTPVDNEVSIYGSLPVDLIYFTGIEKRFKKVELNWVTALEEDNECFIVERSDDGDIFEPIGRVEGNGTSEIGQLLFIQR